jgi:hypothetical protein
MNEHEDDMPDQGDEPAYAIVTIPMGFLHELRNELALHNSPQVAVLDRLLSGEYYGTVLKSDGWKE